MKLCPASGYSVTSCGTRARSSARFKLRGEPLTVYGDGSQTRSFCYVDDLIEGILRLSRSAEHLLVNIGNPGEFTILECAQAVLDVTGSKSELRFEPLPQDDPHPPPRHRQGQYLARLGTPNPPKGRPREVAGILQDRGGECWIEIGRHPAAASMRGCGRLAPFCVCPLCLDPCKVLCTDSRPFASCAKKRFCT